MLRRAGALPDHLRGRSSAWWLLVYTRLPTSFLPQEDQGNIIVNVQLPPGATLERTRAVMEQVEDFILKQPEVQSMVGVLGFRFSGQGQNAGLAFVTLKDWDERKGAEQSAAGAGRPRLRRAVGHPRRLHLPAAARRRFPNWARPRGFTFRLQDRGGNGHEALVAARNQLLGMAAQEQGAGAGAPRRPGRRAAAAARHRPRQGQRAGRGLRRDQHRAVHRARLEPTSTTSRTAAACSAWWCRPMRRRACSRTTCCALNAHQQPGPAGAAVGLRHHALGHRRDADRALQRLPGDAHLRRRRRRATAPARRWPRWSGWRRSCRRASASNGPASRARKSSPARRR